MMKMLQQDAKKSPPKVEVPHKPVKESNSRKKEVEGHEFKLSKFKNVESKVKPLMANPNAKQH